MDAELKEILERIENKIDGLILNQTRPETPVKEFPTAEPKPTAEN